MLHSLRSHEINSLQILPTIITVQYRSDILFGHSHFLQVLEHQPVLWLHLLFVPGDSAVMPQLLVRCQNIVHLVRLSPPFSKPGWIQTIWLVAVLPRAVAVAVDLEAHFVRKIQFAEPRCQRLSSS